MLVRRCTVCLARVEVGPHVSAVHVRCSAHAVLLVPAEPDQREPDQAEPDQAED